MTRLKGGLALSLGAALVGTLLAGWRGALAAGAFGLLATAIQLVAARTMTPQTTRTRGEFVKSWAGGAGLRMLGVIAVGVVIWLNSAQFPYVTIGGRPTGGTPDAPALDLTITVRGIAHAIPATAKVERDGDTLRATGEVRLSHAALGLEPFSVLGGALSVEDAFDVRYRITAHAR